MAHNNDDNDNDGKDEDDSTSVWSLTSPSSPILVVTLLKTGLSQVVALQSRKAGAFTLTHMAVNYFH